MDPVAGGTLPAQPRHHQPPVRRQPDQSRSHAARRSQHRLRPVIEKVFAFTEAGDAYRYFQQGDVFGKVIIDGA
ncbi:zinc-binding dehydrogenase [Mesorhizobium sp. M7A.T.Ca.TU.009.02.1.1]|uniref:zinc-binding dehydrogenase n=1 Tax=Mesorhizobium sp. M7A.T.Ca.TU.009.02.1.1 TaxID=2496791 RepID=UPI001FDF7AC6|nr:zinc-binding dehydrogenase [Mesorhizobium sp. M7A.T.Ca.TU.009.02.1.1]